MSERELRRLEVLARVASGGLSQVQAGIELSLTSRQVRRLQRRYEVQGAASPSGRVGADWRQPARLV